MRHSDASSAPPVMASSVQLLLLLVLYPLLATSVGTNSQRSLSSNQGPEWDRQKINKAKEGTKAVLKFGLSSAVSTLPYAVPFLGLIDPSGTLIAASANLALLPLAMLDKRINDKQILQAMKFEFENVHSKLDQYHQEQKFDTWASSAYAKPEKHIYLGWEDYKTMMKSMLQAKKDDEKDRYRDHFIKSYKKYVPAITELNRLLTVKGVGFTYNLGVLLAQHIKCHEKDLFEYTEFINELIYKGIMMNEFYYKVNKMSSKTMVDKESEIAYSSAQVMFQIHKQCIINSMDYVKKDVENLIDNMKPRSELAKDVRMFLENTYERYDWMVVAFITKNSKHRILETLNKHVLAGFTEVRREAVSVAVARQVKGTHTKAIDVVSVIKQCIPTNTICYKVREVLEKCNIKVFIQPGVPVSLATTYSAVHAYTRSAHDSHNTQEVLYDASGYPEDSSPQTPFIYKGSCEKSAGVKKGNFVVLIKSDEELLNSNPCANRDCGGNQRGKCFPIPDIFLAMCECQSPFYGRDCEKSLDDYKTKLQRETGEIIPVDRGRLVNYGF